MAKLAVLLLVALAVYQCSAFRNGCRLPKKVGLCRAAFPRFFYNAKTKKCERFIFGGCRGNANNFKTLAACKAKCTPRKGLSKCFGPRQRGPCKAILVRYYYDKRGGECRKFLFGGCKGNRNNFKSLAACTKLCKRRHEDSLDDEMVEEENNEEWDQRYYDEEN